MEAEDFPLARSRVNRPVTLPENAVAFTVYRVPSGKGGAPRPVLDGRDVLEIELRAQPEEFERMVLGEPGRYRLDVIDDNGNPIPRAPSCWYMIRERTETSGSGAAVSVNAILHQLTETNRLWAESNQQVTTALAGVLCRIGGLPLQRQGEGREESIREVVEKAIAEELAEDREDGKPIDPEDTAKFAANVKILVDTVADAVPKVIPLIQAGKAAFSSKP